MKTFETEKHNIPESATHYFDETSEEHFAWWNDSKQMLLDPENANEWVAPNEYDDVSNPIEIPQTNIETPEEKEALDSIEPVHLRDYQNGTTPNGVELNVSGVAESFDLIDTTPHQYEMSKFSGSVFNNGDLCVSKEYFGDDVLTFIGMAEGLSFDNDCVVLRNGSAVPVRACVLSKPESPQQREERERLESGKALHSQTSKTEVATEFGIFRLWEMEDKETRDHYCQLAGRIGYRKESNQ